MRTKRRLLLGVAAATVVAVVAVPSALTAAPASTNPCVQPPAWILAAQPATQDALQTTSYPWVQPWSTLTAAERLLPTQPPASIVSAGPPRQEAVMTASYPWVQPAG